MKYLKLTICMVTSLLLTISSVLHAEGVKEKPIARVLNKQIYYSDISQEGQRVSPYVAKMSEEERAEWIKKNEFQVLESLIYSELQNQFLNKTNMNPTDEEIQLHIDFSIRSDENRLGELEIQREDLLNQLESSDLTDVKKKSLKDHLVIVNQLINSQKKREEENKTIPNYAEIKMKSRKRMATSMVTSWKFNKALYQKYGGRVIFQQFGWEPIEAYKMFLDEHKKNKSYEVFDSSFEPIFERMYKYFEMGHSYMKKADADQYFAKPWWDPAFEPM